MTDAEKVAALRAALLEAAETAQSGAKLLAWSEHGRRLRTLAAKWLALLDQLSA